MKIQIKNRRNGTVLFETDAESLGRAAVAAIAAHADLRSADLRGANLSGADLSGADLSSADLGGAYLSSADLSGAYLRSANLSGANLRSANLSGANLSGANLRSADLSGADLSGANLRSADLSGADLSGANLSGANLSGAYLSGAYLRSADLRSADLGGAYLKQLIAQRTILPDGDLIVWKKLQGGIIAKLQIPAAAKRVGGLVGRKCRAEYAIVLEGNGFSTHNGMEYKQGETVKPDKYDPSPLAECSHGIHFFITKQEAEEYN